MDMEDAGFVLSIYLSSDKEGRARFHKNSFTGLIAGLICGVPIYILIFYAIGFLATFDINIFCLIEVLCGILGPMGGFFITGARVVRERQEGS